MTTLKTIKDIEIEGWIVKWNYTGMVNKDNKPHGWGRAIRTDDNLFIDAQYKDGVYHGCSRWIT